MGMNIASAKNARRGRTGRAGRAPMAEINVTPFVDVMLVLLIIFMVAAPMLTVGVPVDLPETKAAALPSESKPVTVSIDGDGTVFLSETRIAVDDLEGQAGARSPPPTRRARRTRRCSCGPTAPPTTTR